MSAISYLTQLVTQLTQKVNLLITNSKKIEELPFQATLDPNSKIAVSRSGEAEHVNIQQIISAISNDNYNRLISVGAISVDPVTHEVTIEAVVEAMINNVTVSKLTDTLSPTTLAATGLVRKDYFFINELGEVLRQLGDEGAVITNPTLPINSVYITEVLVTDSSIGTPTTPIVGDAFVKKIYSDGEASFISGSDISFPLPANGKSFLSFTNPLLTSLSGFNLDLIAGVSGAEVPFQLKDFMIYNNKDTPLTLKHYDDENADIWFKLTNDTDLVIPAFGIVHIKYSSGGCFDLYKSWISGVVDISGKLDKETTVDVEKVYIKKADGTQGMKPTSELGGSLILCKVFKGDLTPITTNGVKTYVGSVYIGNIILPGDIIEVRIAVAKVSGSSSVNPRASLSTTMGAMTHDLVVGILGTTANQQSLNKTSVIAWSNNQHYNALGYGSRYTDEAGGSGVRVFSTMPFNFTDDLWLDFSIQNNASGNTTYLDFAYIKIYRNL